MLSLWFLHTHWSLIIFFLLIVFFLLFFCRPWPQTMWFAQEFISESESMRKKEEYPSRSLSFLINHIDSDFISSISFLPHLFFHAFLLTMYLNNTSESHANNSCEVPEIQAKIFFFFFNWALIGHLTNTSFGLKSTFEDWSPHRWRPGKLGNQPLVIQSIITTGKISEKVQLHLS